MNAPAILAKVRDGEPLDREEINFFAQGLADGKVTDSQAAAFAMAVCLNGLSERERVDLTLAMRDTGKVQQWDLPGPVLDKHSTGGVGDNVSLVLAPALAVCGACVPMISGRGLGHTGGTLDKLDAIPGYRTAVSGRNWPGSWVRPDAPLSGRAKGLLRRTRDSMRFAASRLRWKAST